MRAFLTKSTWERGFSILSRSTNFSPVSGTACSRGSEYRRLPSFRAMASGASEDAKKGVGGAKNKLAFQKSPYLLQHAENPVDW